MLHPPLLLVGVSIGMEGGELSAHNDRRPDGQALVTEDARKAVALGLATAEEWKERAVEYELQVWVHLFPSTLPVFRGNQGHSTSLQVHHN